MNKDKIPRNSAKNSLISGLLILKVGQQPPFLAILVLPDHFCANLEICRTINISFKEKKDWKGWNIF